MGKVNNTLKRRFNHVSAVKEESRIGGDRWNQAHVRGQYNQLMLMRIVLPVTI